MMIARSRQPEAKASRMEEEIRFSVIIPCLNEQLVIGRCLEALKNTGFDSNQFEVILADNGSRDATLEVAKSTAEPLNLRVLSLAGVRVTALRNSAAAISKGRFLAFLDADCVVPRNWFLVAEETFLDPAAGVIGGHCGIPANSPWVVQVWYADRQCEKRGEVSYLPGANLMMSAENFRKVGGFDESLETNEDCELCERARKHGLKVTSYPELGVIHLRFPQTLRAFYSKQVWHGKHVLRVFVRSLPSLVNARPIFFASLTLLAVLGMVVSVGTRHWWWTAVSAMLALLPSAVLSFRLALRRQKWTDFPGLLVLHLAYGFGRTLAMIDIRNWVVRTSKSTERARVRI
jgi:glycosyltransferase involved in cell wall biosynthesis